MFCLKKCDLKHFESSPKSLFGSLINCPGQDMPFMPLLFRRAGELPPPGNGSSISHPREVRKIIFVKFVLAFGGDKLC